MTLEKNNATCHTDLKHYKDDLEKCNTRLNSCEIDKDNCGTERGKVQIDLATCTAGCALQPQIEGKTENGGASDASESKDWKKKYEECINSQKESDTALKECNEKLEACDGDSFL